MTKTFKILATPCTEEKKGRTYMHPHRQTSYSFIILEEYKTLLAKFNNYSLEMMDTLTYSCEDMLQYCRFGFEVVMAGYIQYTYVYTYLLYK